MATLKFISTTGSLYPDDTSGRKLFQAKVFSFSPTKLVLQTGKSNLVELIGKFVINKDVNIGDLIDPSMYSGTVNSWNMYGTEQPLNISTWKQFHALTAMSESLLNFFDYVEHGDLGLNLLRGNDSIVGTDLNNGDHRDEFQNRITGDLLRGFNGNDTIDGAGGDDSLWGDRGNDSILGGDGDDTLVGGAGNDTLNGGAGSNELFGGTGNDTYIVDFRDGSEVKVTINEITGLNDRIQGFSDNLESNDNFWDLYLRVNQGKDLLIMMMPTPQNSELKSVLQSFFGEGGYDEERLQSSATKFVIVRNQYELKLNKFIQRIESSNQLDRNNPRSFVEINMKDFLFNKNKKEIIGTSRADFIVSNGENLDGRDGNDILNAKCVFNQEVLTINGGSGNDEMTAAVNDTLLIGGAGDDRLAGKSGNDTLEGGLGRDMLEAGGGRNSFVFRAIADSGITPASADVIGEKIKQRNDFTIGEDKIDLSFIDANSQVVSDQAFAFSGTSSGKNAAWVTFDPSLYKNQYNNIGSSILWVDNSGDAKADMCVVIVGVDLRSFQSNDWLVL